MTPEGEGINVADVPFPPGPHGFLCDLGRVASEPPVPGHDHGEDVDVGSVSSGDSCVSLASSESAGHYLRWTEPRPCS